MNRWTFVWVIVGMIGGVTAWGQTPTESDQAGRINGLERENGDRAGNGEGRVRNSTDLQEEAFGRPREKAGRNHRIGPYRTDRRELDEGVNSWNRLGTSRARRFRLRSECGPGYGGYHGLGAYRSDGFGDRFPGYIDADLTDYAEIFLNQSYYDDGPYGPGFYDRRAWYLWYRSAHRAGQLLDARVGRLDDGLGHFRSGQYDRAAVALLGASRLDHTNAASRVHAGHALFAVGRYDEAVKLLARAFELAPRLATSSYDIRDDYGARSDFDKHLERLKHYVVAHPKDADGLTILGYVVFYTQGPGPAYGPLARAARLRSKDTFIPKLLEISRAVRPMEPTRNKPFPVRRQRHEKKNPPRSGSIVRTLDGARTR